MLMGISNTFLLKTFILLIFSIFISDVRSENSNQVLSFGYFDGSLNDPLSIDGSKFSHIIYAFGTIDSNNQVQPFNQYEDVERIYHQSQNNCISCLKGSYYQLFLLKQKYPHLKIILSIGGWGNSQRFSDTFLTPQSRQVFIQSITNWFTKFPIFEGVDIDWEYPVSGGDVGTNHNENDGINLAAFIKELREYWNLTGHQDWYITLALPASIPDYLANNISVMNIFVENLNWILIMLYELAYGTSVTRHNSNWSPSSHDTGEAKYRCVHQCLESYLTKSSFKLTQLIIGIPFFSREYYAVRNNSTEYPGLNMPFNKDIALGTSGYNVLMEEYLNNGFIDYYDPEAQASYLYNPNTHIYATYESKKGVLPKVNFIIDKGLGGIFYWELGRDSKLPQYSIVNYVNELLKIDYSLQYNKTSVAIDDKRKKNNKMMKTIIKTEDNICNKFTSLNSEFYNTNCHWKYEDNLMLEHLLSTSSAFPSYKMHHLFMTLLFFVIIGTIFI
ncbi:glycoside hydrolase [Piromyces finnis]|uniref:Glycoside hydrolase n=1 Tax=Piromyces finnis TaxID=1754191 RepID=A0A1Y1VN39_9FUNG|nr:glycoside hydrolase [Piromyces finnis]|eukprot:ORX59324.1 glycoside hydrolase [Piromyces finnis]